MSDSDIPWTAACQASLFFTISQSLLKFMPIESVMLSNHLILCHPFSFCLQSFPASGSFLMSHHFTSGGQHIGASASASVLPMNIQGWFPLGLTGLTSLQSKEIQDTVYWLKDVHKEQETNYSKDFPGGQVVKTLTSSTGSSGSIPGRRN